ncbi:unnamed protein product [Leuciscus chuanchicus]
MTQGPRSATSLQLENRNNGATLIVTLQAVAQRGTEGAVSGQKTTEGSEGEAAGCGWEQKAAQVGWCRVLKSQFGLKVGLVKRHTPSGEIPQHSMQISRQSEDSQHASIMPQSMSQGQLQSSPRSSPQQQQQQASDVQVPHEA